METKYATKYIIEYVKENFGYDKMEFTFKNYN
jgi:hypothetical protein